MANPRVNRLQRASQQAAKNCDIINELRQEIKALERAKAKLQESLDESLEKQLELYNQLELARKAINIVAYECSRR